jgi:cysteinyl-tRNA synthetase
MLKLFNSLTKNVEEFKPIRDIRVGMYSCGPTVYQFAHIGNFRAYMTSDLLARTLRYNGYDVNFVMNITDVGHLVSDADTGEDKLEKSAKKEGKTAWEVAEFYTEAFLKDYQALGLTMPDILAKATDHIQEQIELIQAIEANGFTYTTSDGVYFDTSLLPDYGKMSSLDTSSETVARVAENDEKKNPRDFALWKFSYPKTPSNSPLSGGEISHPDGPDEGGRLSFDHELRAEWLDRGGRPGRVRHMEWNSPWGKGFPGWHIECSAMSMKYLGETFDIHTGGVDHKEIHHPNEIAQSEVVTHKPLAKYWVHTAFMLVAGQKMSKSLGNTYTLYDLEKEGYDDPMVLRYLYMNANYRQEMNFTYEAMDAAKNALSKLRRDVAKWEAPVGDIEIPGGECAEYEARFLEAINDDLNMPEALGVVWEMVKSDKSSGAKAKSIFRMDRVLGLNLQEAAARINEEEGIIPGNIQHLVEERQRLRKEKHFNAADKIRSDIKKLGYEIEDTKKGIKVRKI